MFATFATAASGHGEGPSFEVVPSQVVVGDTVSVLGEGLQPLGPVSVALITAAGEQRILVGEVDDVGHFNGTFVVPELSARVYELRATDSARLQVSTFLTVIATDDAAEASAVLSPLGLALVAVLAAAVAVAPVLTLGARRRARVRAG